MKIESSSISFQSQHATLEFSQSQESLQFWVGDNPSTAMGSPPGVIIDISDKGRNLQKSLGGNEVCCLEEDPEYQLSEKDKHKLMLIEAMMEYFLGRKVKLQLPKGIKVDQSAMPDINAEPRMGWGLVYDFRQTHYESEKIFFSTTGKVKTSDGKIISIDLQLNMSREFYSSQSLHVRAGDAVRKDPLVINFDAPAAKLSESKFSFDIDCDGYPDQISQLCKGSGFLALDLNGDGKINDGSELFGPKSNDGFSDLSNYDTDENGWIDENDDIFDKLRIWTKDEYGNDTLFALGQKGIGAICLSNAITPFSLRGSDNKENGVIQKTGIFLKDNGSAGTIQHVDLAI